MRGCTCYSQGPLKEASQALLSPMPIHYCCWFVDSDWHLHHVGERPGPPCCPRSHLLLKMNFRVDPSPCITRPCCWSSSQMYKMLSVIPYFFVHRIGLVVFTFVASCLRLFAHLVLASSIVIKSQWQKKPLECPTQAVGCCEHGCWRSSLTGHRPPQQLTEYCRFSC
jgi:hypothetical protein